MPDSISILKLIWPLIVFQLAVQIYALIDLIRKRKTKSLSFGLWLLIVIFGEILGAILYFIVGRAEEE